MPSMTYAEPAFAVKSSMPYYRRAIIPGGTFFFTVVVNRRQPLFADFQAVELLGKVMRECKRRWPFAVDAIVLLPDHWHAIWSLPSGDANYSARIGWIKKEFTKAWLADGNNDFEISNAKSRQRRKGIWQPRFWEHTIEDDDDLERHFDYIHWNPVKHGYVDCPRDWPNSSFRRWVDRGMYPAEWGCGNNQAPQSIATISDVGEPS